MASLLVDILALLKVLHFSRRLGARLVFGPDTGGRRRHSATGMEAIDGLANLLRTNVPADDTRSAHRRLVSSFPKSAEANFSGDPGACPCSKFHPAINGLPMKTATDDIRLFE